MKARAAPAVALALALGACGSDDLHRMAGVPQGKLVAGLGMPMREVGRLSTVRLHKLPTLGLPSGTYADGNAYFDFELAQSGLRFQGCSMYSLDYEDPGEVVQSISVCLTSGKLAWKAFTAELRETAAKLKADGWQPAQPTGRPGLEAFVAQDGSRVGSSDSGAIGTFEWTKGPGLASLTAHRSWDSPRFWSSLDLLSAERRTASKWKGKRWLEEFTPYENAGYVCKQHVLGSADGKRAEIDWTMYATGDEPAAVVAFYAGKPDPAATTISIAGKDARNRLSVHPVSGSYPACLPKPGPWVKTVIVVSQMTK